MTTAPRPLSVGLSSACFGRCPDRKAECNLVHEVSKVVHQVKNAVLDAAHQIAKEVAERVDGPTNGHDETHGCKGCLNVLVHAVALLGEGASLTCEDLVQDEAPASHAKDKAHERIHELGLTSVAKSPM